MKEAILGKETLSQAQKNLLAFVQNQDLQYVAEDAVFKNISTGEEYRGRAEIGAMLHYMYQVAFDAKSEVKNYEIAEDKAFVEGVFRGRHIADYAGIPATQKEVTVPYCKVFDIKNGMIKAARIFMMNEVLLQQLGAPSGATPQKIAFVTRDIFRLKFGHFKEVKPLLEEAMKNQVMPTAKLQKVYTDFTGDAYRLILEQGFDTLADYERTITQELGKAEWQQWYEQFKPHVESSHREILRQIM